MPHRMWKHTCTEDGSAFLLGSPVCGDCSGGAEYVGWHYSMYESMGRYQTFYGLKPMGPHRPFADRLLEGSTADCQACDGRGLLDASSARGLVYCEPCHGWGRLLTVRAAWIGESRAQVLKAFPDAAAPTVPHFSDRAPVMKR